ncbi:MAG: hypothetical protein R2827_06105 [Bdellovibrionales bacterium]
MEFIFCIQPSDQIFQDIKGAVRALDQHIKLVRFGSAQELSDFIKKMMSRNFSERERSNLFPGGLPDEMKVLLFIFDADSIDPMNLSSFEEIQRLLVSKRFCDDENPVGFVITDTAPSDEKINKFIHPVVRNFLVTPFEPMTLKGFLRAAIDGNAPVTDELYIHKCSEEVEMIKTVQLMEINELGFKTFSDKDFPKNKRARYYSNRFGTGNERPIYAQCMGSKKIGEENYISSFGFFGASKDHLMTVRKLIMQERNAVESPIPGEEGTTDKIDFMVLSTNERLFRDAEQFIQERFEGVRVLWIETERDFDNIEDKSNVVGVLIQEEVIEKASLLATPARKCLVNDEWKIFVCGNYEVKDSATLDKVKLYEDLLTFPLDRFYFVRKMRQHFPSWRVKKDSPITQRTIEVDEPIETASPIRLNSVSELSISFDYHRAFEVAEARDFRLQMPDGSSERVIKGISNYCGKKPDGNFICEFVFYAIDEVSLIFIRKWIIQASASPQE